MNRHISVFIDEYGDTSIRHQKEGVQTYFIVTAAFVYADELEVETKKVGAIRDKFFRGAEMKSQGLSDRHRINVLEALREVSFRTFSIPVDKRELDNESGLAYRNTFFKFINKQLYKRIYRIFENVDVVADEHGGEAFMQSFEKYIERQVPPNLFAKRTFRFADSKNEVFLQVADIVSGSIARFLDPDKLSPDGDQIYKLIAPKSVGIDPWPPKGIPSVTGQLDASERALFDEAVRRHCLKQARDFLSEQDPTEKFEIAQCEVLELLLFQAQFGDDDQYISTRQILSHLCEFSGIEMKDIQLRNQVIARLRDSGVIVASSTGSNSGYKIPTSASDISDFVAHANSIVPAMLRRLKRARDELRLYTQNDYDILGDSAHTVLKSLVDELDKHS